MIPAGGRSRARPGYKVLVVAYACHPSQGSEPGAGWKWLEAIARSGPVILVTGIDDDGALELKVDELRLPVTVVRVSTVADVISIGSPLRHMRYIAWLFAAAKRVKELESEGQISVGHHLTYAADWLPSPLAAMRSTPYIWGPVGGSTYTPRDLRAHLVPAEKLFELARRLIGELGRHTIARKTTAKAKLIIALNQDTARRFGRFDVRVEPNVALAYDGFPPTGPAEHAPRATCVGRLLGWKGVRFAIEAMKDPRLADWTLDIYGDGPARPYLEELSRCCGVANRVRFYGNVPRDVLMAALSKSTALVFPSMHDSAPWSVAEAAALGVPVLCFPVGGAPSLAGPCLRLLDPKFPVASVTQRLVELHVDRPGRTPFREFGYERLGPLVRSWYDEATLVQNQLE